MTHLKKGENMQASLFQLALNLFQQVQNVLDHREDLREALADIRQLGRAELAQLRRLDATGLLPTIRSVAQEVVEVIDRILSPADSVVTQEVPANTAAEPAQEQ